MLFRSFFVSCERLFRPVTRNVPVVVLSSNDGCAVARSNEAKELGIKMGDPLHELKKRFTVIDGTSALHKRRQGIIAFSANFELYGDISRRVAAVLMRITPRLELYSIDEAFLDISQLEITDYESWGRTLAATIEREVGVPVSVGVAPTKTLCKLAADYAKHHPDCGGAYYISAHCADEPVHSAAASERRAVPPSAQSRGRRGTRQTPFQEWKTVLTMTPVADIWGIGWRLTPRLRAEGIHTAADLAAMPPKRAQQLMGIHGRRIVAELNGTSCIPMNTVHKPQQVISRGRQFGRDTGDIDIVSAAAARMTNHACHALRREGLLATRATVWLMTNRKKPAYTVVHIDVRLYMPTADTGYIAHQLITMLRHRFDSRHAWHKAEVTLWNLMPDSSLQTELFGIVSPAQYERSTALMTALDHLNRKHGKGMLRYAAEDLSHAWYPRRSMQSPPYTTDWRKLPELRATEPAGS